MKIFVCIKQVPDTETKVKLATDKTSIDTTSVKWVMNPYDEYAVEEAIKTRDANAGSQVWAISVGPKKRVVEALRTALVMCADEAIAIDAPESLDQFQTAKTLASVIQQEGDAKVIFTGKLAIDDNASAVSQMVAEFLNIPHATVVSKFSFNGENIVVERDADGGSREVMQMQAPAVVAANKGLNMPRYASLPGIMKAKKKTIKEVDGAALLAGSNNKLKVVSMEMPPEKPAVKLLPGDAAAQSAALVNALRNEAKVL